MLKLNAAAVAALLAISGNAFAVSAAVKVACKPDYLAFCNNMVVGSAQLRSCMRSNALKLSKPCRQALVDNKEVTKADADDYRARTKEVD